MKWDNFIKKAFAPNPSKRNIAAVAQRKELVNGQEVVVDIYPTPEVKLTQQVRCRSGRKVRSASDVRLPIAG